MTDTLLPIMPAWAYDCFQDVRFCRIAGATLAETVDPGARPVGRAGRGTDWFGRREYVPGDPLNIIDWRSLARHADREDPPMFVKTFDAELANLTTICLDCSASMETHPEANEGKFRTALGVAGLLAMAAANQGDPVELAFSGLMQREPIAVTPIMRSMLDIRQQFDQLHTFQLRAAGNKFWELLADPFQGLRGTRHTLVLISDFFTKPEYIADTLAQWRTRVRTLLAVRVLSHSDRHPFTRGRDVELIDVENPTLRKPIRPDVEQYTRQLNAHLRTVESIVAQESVRFADIRAIPGEVVRGSQGEISEPRKISRVLIESGILEPI